MLSTASSQVRLGATFATRTFGAIGGSIFAFLIARNSSPTTLGQFTMFVSVLGVAGLLAQRGLNMVLIRAVAEERSHAPDSDTKGLFFTTIRMCILPSIVLSLMGALLLNSDLLGERIKGAEMSFVVALPMLTLLALVSAYLKGIGKPWISPLFEIGGISGIASLVLLPLMVVGHIGPEAIMIAFVAGLGATCMLAWLTLRGDFRHDAVPTTAPSIDLPAAARWSGQYDFMIMALSAFMLQAGSFAIAGTFLPNHDLGLIRGAERLAVIVSFPVLAINPFIASQIVKFHVTCDMGGLRRTAYRAMAVGVIISVIPFLTFVLFPTACLSLIGHQFVAAAPFLRLMALANFVIVMFGPSAMVVNMSRIERSGMIVSAIFLALGLVLFPVLTVVWGASGFVAAYCIVGVGRAVAVHGLARKVYRVPTEGLSS